MADKLREISDFYRAALELPEGERAAFLLTCVASDEVRLEVASLLEHEKAGERLLDSPALEVAARMMAKQDSMLMIGKILGHYQITGGLGSGGMGEVFRARDQTLGREVAIKVLPDEFAQDPDRIARFRREAKVLAALNHPNIAAIYGLEESGGTNFLVLELVEGPTLADRLRHGPIPVQECLKLALQMAEALGAAHDKGIIHRDLKPANIKITADAQMKVLDFGLAKTFTSVPENLNLTNSPTIADTATNKGVILGTAAYMSPEQARGKPVDKRSDIWGFGCVLFEMLTGRAAFSGQDVSDILAAVIRAEPEWNNLPWNLHGRLREVLERCLNKDLKNRYQDISDVRVDIQKVLTDPSRVRNQPVTMTEGRKRFLQVSAWLAAALAVAVLIAFVAFWNRGSSESRQVVRFDYELPEGQQLNTVPLGQGLSLLAVSPDGKRFAYATPKGLYLRNLDESASKLLTSEEENTQQPLFSPDGKWIGYFSVSDRQLKKIAVNGGPPVKLADVGFLLGASWGSDNTIVYGFPEKTDSKMLRISASGGTAETLVKAKSGRYVGMPEILPDGKSVLYLTGEPGGVADVMVLSMKTGETRKLTTTTSRIRYLTTGHLVQQRGDKLFALPLDLNKVEISGDPVQVLAGVQGFAVSDSGTLVYVSQVTGTAPQGATAKGRTLVWVDRNGHEEPLGTPPQMYFQPSISPDGTRVAVTIEFAEIWAWDIIRKTPTRLTFNSNSSAIAPVWTRDGKRIVYASMYGKSSNGIYWKLASGALEQEKVISTPDGSGYVAFPYCWSRDGKTLIGAASPGIVGAPGKTEIWTLAMEGNREKRSLLEEEYLISQPKISPNGRWLAYTSMETRTLEVYVCSFPDVKKGRWQISSATGGNTPIWSRDGTELFYRRGDDDTVMDVRVTTEPDFSVVGPPKALFRGEYAGVHKAANDGVSWDISPNGKFLMIRESSLAATTSPIARKLSVVLNWTEELKQKAPQK